MVRFVDSITLASLVIPNQNPFNSFCIQFSSFAFMDVRKKALDPNVLKLDRSGFRPVHNSNDVFLFGFVGNPFCVCECSLYQYDSFSPKSLSQSCLR
ncbi:hypothetical protein NPIL_338421 [Nephila pilipes]|uniref:Uncharacterized protein n=1 Tax=Nephila pilipes TaxID=299642 RepID=A0A8X6QVY8_NEPPI|nr:hypothetical protein NPIL_338421 [Nephila pilipes]